MLVERNFTQSLTRVFVLSAIATLTACGGGGGSSTDSGSATPPVSTPSPTPTPTPTPVNKSLQVRVIDGAIKNALVCLDKNLSGTCDADEPSGRTNASGDVTLTILESDAGKYPVLAMVGTDAVDADLGPVSTPYAMSTPADNPSLVSPLTTMVHTHSKLTGLTTSEAEAAFKKVVGLTGPMMTDYTKGASADENFESAVLAQTIAFALQGRMSDLTEIVGVKDNFGATITRADIEKYATQRVYEDLPEIGRVSLVIAKDPSVRTATSPIKAASDYDIDLIASLDGEAAKAMSKIGVEKVLASGVKNNATTVDPDGTLQFIDYQSPGSWSYRGKLSTAADQVPDASGLRKYYDYHRGIVSGQNTEWGFASTYERRGDLHWNGSAWVGCDFGYRNSSSVRDSAGISKFNYCDNYSSGFTKASAVDISGRKLSDVFSEVRAFKYDYNGTPSFGTFDLGLLGNSVFPEKSKLYYYQETAQYNPGYDPRSSNIFQQYTPAVGAGGDTRIGTFACGANSLSASSASTLESVIATHVGKPCIFATTSNSDGSSGSRNENWGYTTIGIGIFPTSSTATESATGYYKTASEWMRFAFTGPNQVTIYSCQVRRADSSPRNCNTLTSGPYVIKTFGDARLLTLPPYNFNSTTSYRNLVERGGSVYYGYQVKDTSGVPSIRLNLTAGNAVLSKLGISEMAAR